MVTGTQWIRFFFAHIPGKLNCLADYFSQTSVQLNTTILNEDSNLAFSNDILPIVLKEVNVNYCENNQNECTLQHISLTACTCTLGFNTKWKNSTYGFKPFSSIQLFNQFSQFC